MDTSKSISATVTLYPPLSISVAPQTGTLSPGDNLQFTADVVGAFDPAVTWTISPACAGTITSTGLYTGPLYIPSQQSVTITATSVGDPTKSASATVTFLIWSDLVKPLRV